MARNRPSETEAAEAFSTMLIKEWRAVASYPVHDGVLGDAPSALQPGAYRAAFRDGNIVEGPLRFVDATDSRKTGRLPSFVFAGPDGTLMLMPIDVFRTAVISGTCDLVGGHLEGTFQVVACDWQDGFPVDYYVAPCQMGQAG